jgi:PTH1 family peptidyl-tRNA hydrolase
MSKDARIPDGRVLVVGLGNPGPKYVGTRHNIGLGVVSELARRWGIAFGEGKFRALSGVGSVGQRQCLLLLPQTFMNLSGESVQLASRFYKREADSIVVAHDDIDLLLGKVKLKLGGGHGGHNGLRSCDKHLGTRDYFRIRLGVGRPPHPSAEVSNWVLGRFASASVSSVEHLVDTGADAIERLLTGGLLEAQGMVHPISPPSP